MVLELARSIVMIPLRLDRNGPTGWECRIVNVEIIVLEREASEDRSDRQNLPIW